MQGAAVASDILAKRWQIYNGKVWDIRYKLGLIIW